MLAFILGSVATVIVLSSTKEETRNKIFNYFDLRKK
jgi:hypothetical protein